MTALTWVSNLIVDCVIAAAALVCLYRLARYLNGLARDRWAPAPAPYDPFDVDVWHVLADARAITEAAAKETHATE